MATLSLKISMEGGTVVKTIQFDPVTHVYDACRIIREKILEANSSDPKEFGLFLASEEDNKKGIWLEASRSLDYYMLRNGDMLEYNKKTRNLRVRMLDGTVKTLLVDDSQIVANLMVVICTKIGITNYDEYGLVREDQKEEPEPYEKGNYGTLTLRRRHHEKERDAKMEQLRKKLRTDDEVNWVEPSKTLREQGIDATETLLLRRKLFFSDRNVDSRDPVQLNLLYVQARDAILDGTHPVTQQKACEFAGIQCQIQFGDHKEDKHTTGFLDLKEFLPSSYVKVKGIEKKVFKEHRRHAGVSELDAKVLYTKSARDLPTYGVAFFLVKEKMKGKNKLVPRLLGVTKDSVLRLDEKTKEILQTWPLTTVRRWCASPNTFTLDFGDYRANIIQHDTFKSGKVNMESVAKPAVMRPGAEGAKPFAVGHVTGAQQSTVSGQLITGHAPPATTQVQQTRVTSVLTEPQRALLSSITSGRDLIKKTEEELTRSGLPAVGGEGTAQWRSLRMDSSKQVVTSHIAAMNAATAQVVTLTAGPTEEVDHTAVGAAITTITTNLPEMSKGVRMIAALMDDSESGDKLLDATRQLCAAFTDLLRAAEPDTPEPRQNLLNAASRVGEASTSVLYTIGEETPQDKETQDILLSLAKAVANTTAALVLKAKNVAAHCKDEQPLQNTIISAATNCALATSQLVACAKVVAPTLHNPQCREQLRSAARQVSQAVERLVAACEAAPPAAAPGVSQLSAAAKRVTDELERLLAHCDLESVLSASERVGDAPDSAEMVRRARHLGQATAQLIAHIKTEAEKQGSENQGRLLAAAKLLADATARMVEAARLCATSPQLTSVRWRPVPISSCKHYIINVWSRCPCNVGLCRQESARQVAAAATQLVTSAHNAAHYNTNKYSQPTDIHRLGTYTVNNVLYKLPKKFFNSLQFLYYYFLKQNVIKFIYHRMPQIQIYIKFFSKKKIININCSYIFLTFFATKSEGESRDEMVRSMKTVTVNSSKLLGTAKSVSQDLTRPNAKNQLADAARAVTESINHLVDVCTEAAPGQKECAAAIRSIESTRPLLSQPSQPLTDLGYFACLDAVVAQSKALSEGMSGMASSIKKSDTNQFCRSVAGVGDAVQTLVECTAQAAYLVLSAATVIAKHTSALCNACRVASGRSTEPQSKRHFVQAAKDVANCTADLDNLARCATATGPLLESVQSLCQFADSPEFAAVPAKISPQARLSQETILDCGRSIISGSCSMLEAARALMASSSERSQWQQLAAHSKTVSDSIKRLVTDVREKAPGQRECARALDQLSLQLRELDHVAIQAVGQELTPRQTKTLQGYCEQVESTTAEIVERLEPLRVAATSEAENLGHAVLQLVSYAEPLVSGSAGAASNLTDSEAQSGLLQHARTVLETLALLVQAAKQAGGNPREFSCGDNKKLDRLIIKCMYVCVCRMSLVGSYDEQESFVEYQTRMVAAAKDIARLGSDMTAKSVTEASRLLEIGSDMCRAYERLATDSVGAAATTPSADVANRYRLLLRHADITYISLSDKEGDTFSNHREGILKTAKTLVEDTKSLVGGAGGTQEQLAAAAQSAVGTISKLSGHKSSLQCEGWECQE
ncbi:unnamed protein product, partial [Leptidea sinapis]